MKRRLGQAADRFHQFLPAQLPGFGDSPSLQQFGEQRSAGHRGHASLGEKAKFLDASIDDFQGELEDIATCRVFDLDRRVRIGNFTGIAWVLEVIENLRRVHREKLYRAGVARAALARVTCPSIQAFASKSTSIASISGISQLTSF